MPAGPIGDVWAAGTWPPTTWQANSWASRDLGGALGGDDDLTTLFCAYLVTLAATDPEADDITTELTKATGTVRAGSASLDDLNTAYLDYLT